MLVPWKPPFAGPPAMPNTGVWNTSCTARLKRKSSRSLAVQLWLILTSNDVGFLRSRVLAERLLSSVVDCALGMSAMIFAAIGLINCDGILAQLAHERAESALTRLYSYADPWNWLVPDLSTTFVTAPAARPNSAV